MASPYYASALFPGGVIGGGRFIEVERLGKAAADVEAGAYNERFLTGLRRRTWRRKRRAGRVSQAKDARREIECLSQFWLPVGNWRVRRGKEVGRGVGIISETCPTRTQATF